MEGYLLALLHVPVLEMSFSKEQHDFGVSVAEELAQAALIHFDCADKFALSQVHMSQIEPYIGHRSGRLPDFRRESPGR